MILKRGTVTIAPDGDVHIDKYEFSGVTSGAGGIEACEEAIRTLQGVVYMLRHVSMQTIAEAEKL